MKHYYMATNILKLFRYVIVLNGIESIKEALLKKSSQFSSRAAPFSNVVMNEDSKGLTLTCKLSNLRVQFLSQQFHLEICLQIK